MAIFGIKLNLKGEFCNLPKEINKKDWLVNNLFYPLFFLFFFKSPKEINEKEWLVNKLFYSLFYIKKKIVICHRNCFYTNSMNKKERQKYITQVENVEER